MIGSKNPLAWIAGAAAVVAVAVWILVTSPGGSPSPPKKRPPVAERPRARVRNDRIPLSVERSTAVRNTVPVGIRFVDDVSAAPPDDLIDSEGAYRRREGRPEEKALYTAEYVHGKKPLRHPLPSPLRGEGGVLWKLPLHDGVCGRPVYRSGILYLPSYDRRVLFVEAESGRIVRAVNLWSQPVGDAVEYDGMLLVAQASGAIAALDMRTGRRLWRHEIGLESPSGKKRFVVSSLAVFRGRVYVSKSWGNVYVLRAGDGMMEKVLGVPYESAVHLPAVSMAGGVVFCNVAGEIVCFDKNDAPSWKCVLEEGYPLTLAVKGDRLLVADTRRRFFAVDAASRRVAWSMRTQGRAFDALTLQGTIAFLAAGGLYAVDIDSGRVVWKVERKVGGKFGLNAPAILGGIVYVVDTKGTLRGFDVHDGMERFSYRFSGDVYRGLLAGGGKVFVCTLGRKRYVYALDVSGK